MSQKQNYFSKRILSFTNAFRGIWQVIKHEANFKIHLLAAVVVIILGFVLHISLMEWLVVVLTIGVVMGAETFNSAIEKLVDITHPEQDKKAGLIKDMAAGAVLIIAIAAAIIGFIIFIPKIIDWL